jgi:hypothetical protein
MLRDVRARLIACSGIVAVLAVSTISSAGASEQSSRSPARESCDDIYESPPAKIARAVQVILHDKEAEEADVDIPDADLDEYLDAYFGAEAKIERWLTKHCLVCTTSDTTAPAATAVLQICPIGANGRLLDSFAVEEVRKHGGCDGDPSAKVQTALRCGAGDVIYDPCWPEIGAERPAVVCVSAPWDDSVTRVLTKSRELVKRSEYEYPAWGVELESGERCSLYGSGAHASVEGSNREADVMDYYCGRDDTGRVLLRGFDQTGPLWHARGYDRRKRERLPDQTIVRAWF